MGLKMQATKKNKLTASQQKMKAVLKPIVERILNESDYYGNSELKLIREIEAELKSSHSKLKDLVNSDADPIIRTLYRKMIPIIAELEKIR